ncbi:MAG: hypothetical protein EOO99_04145 [Pedobacter sp.]|nr:MAG: hypothetical protein EOO99_04145 [Pedobacter sp.]
MYLESSNLSDKTKKYLSILIKLTVLIAAGWIIYSKTNANSDFQTFLKSLNGLSLSQSIFYLAAVVILMFLNWGLEARKWRFLMRKIEPQTYWSALSGVYCGLTWAVFTPNRLGEYGGRILTLRPSRRIPGLFAMTVGSLSQMVVTNVCGLIAGLVFLYQFQLVDFRLTWGIGIFGLMFIVLYLLAYFHIRLLNNILSSFKLTRRFKKFYAVLARYSKPELFRIITYSLFRYLVFTLQYVLLFLWLIPELPSSQVAILIMVFFFVQAYLPSLDLLDLGVRSLTGLYFFNLLSDKSSAIVACFAIIWFVNIIIPAILGSYFVLKLNLFGNAKSHI